MDGARAADELQRVLRPGGGVVVCVRVVDWDGVGGAPTWSRELEAVLDALRAAADHPGRGGAYEPEGLGTHGGFAPLERHDAPFVFRTRRAEILDHLASISVIATLPTPRRESVLADLEAVLVSAGVDRVDVPQVARLWVTRRR